MRFSKLDMDVLSKDYDNRYTITRPQFNQYILHYISFTTLKGVDSHMAACMHNGCRDDYGLFTVLTANDCTVAR